MKKLLKAAAVFGVSAVVLSGCATKSYVNEQIGKLQEQISNLEGKVGTAQNQASQAKYQANMNAQKIQQLEKGDAYIRARLQQVEGTASAAYQKATSNEQAIEDLNAALQRQSQNIERILGKHYAK